MSKKISIKDIARELNISTTTVSFVINGKSEEMGISPATSSKVMKLIREKNYTPSNAARFLRTGKSNTIGLIVEDLGNYFFGNVAKVIELEASNRGYNVFLSSTDNNPLLAKQLIRKMRNSSVDGLIITPTHGLKDELTRLVNDQIPFVLLDRLVPGIDANHVILDNYKGAYTLTRHLIEKGYKKIGFITIVSNMSMMAERERGYREAIFNNGMHIDELNILKLIFDDQSSEGIEKISEFLRSHRDLDALFFATNYLGVLGLEAMKQVGIEIPKHMGVVSFDDNDLFRLNSPSITVASQPIQ
ncbi:MAG: hypothetical protein RL131_633, partial [Bacteroidota bacterium]